MKTCHVVFQTHWDREWYLPFETFRHRFMHVMERIVNGIETGDIDQFVLDGQMAAIEDYVDVCSDSQKGKIKQLIEDGKIIIGPWYVLADEFLVSGESLWRNLEIGLETAGKYGHAQKVGYLPDTFGHVSQMPQILHAFDIDSAILWRGIKPEHSEFQWRSPDGSEVFTVFLPEGYYQPLLNEEKAEEALVSFVEKVAPYSQTDELLLTNGGDHLMPSWGSLKERMENASNDEVVFVASTYERYLDAVRKKVKDLDTYEGEMRSNEHIYVLPNVLSSRSYLKQQNQEIEDMLTRYVEPMLTVAGVKELDSYLLDTWKLLLQNHPHDSICGCSIDDVHKEMETRTMKLRQRLDALQQEAIYRSGGKDFAMTGLPVVKPFEEMTAFTVFNPHPYRYNGWVEAEVWFYEEREFAVEYAGAQIPTVIVDQWRDRYFASPTDAFPEFKDVVKYKVAFNVTDLPALSFQTFSVTEINSPVLEKAADHFIENEWMKVTLEQGDLQVLDKETNETYGGMNHFYSSMDAGDEYNYSPPVHDVMTKAVVRNSPSVYKSEGVQKLSYSAVLTAPKALNEARSGPAEETGQIEIDVDITLFVGDPIAKVRLHVSNQIKDQRLRVVFPQVHPIDDSFSDTAFDMVKRPAKKHEELDAEKQKEVAVVVEPSASFIHVNRFCFVHRGLQEYQVTENSELEVTLIRGVGWLSRDDLRTRGGGAGPSFPTPDAQCLGDHTFEYGFGFTTNPEESIQHANEFRNPPKAYEGKVTSEPLITFSNPTIQLSAVRQKGEQVEVRIWNPSDESLHTQLESRFAVHHGAVRCGDQLELPAKGIVTLNLTGK
ncbi:glycoside hydrolase family 38 [Halobacillus fulvus]|nr:glycoside hydrolase family 38 [Halobacillus fulvus]